MNAALRQARESCASVATIPKETLDRPLLVYRIRDKVTGEQRTVRSVILGVEVADDTAGADMVLKDWELLEKLNGLVGARRFRGKNSLPPPETAPIERALDRGVSLVRERGSDLSLPFRFPEAEAIAVLWPVASSPKEQGTEDEGGDIDEVEA